MFYFLLQETNFREIQNCADIAYEISRGIPSVILNEFLKDRKTADFLNGQGGGLLSIRYSRNVVEPCS